MYSLDMRWLIVGLIVLCGCSTLDEYQVNLDPEFTAEERDMVTRAARRWETVAADSIRLDIRTSLPTSECGSIDVMKREPDPGLTGQTNFFNKPFCDRSEIRSISDDHRVWLHEFGHALGIHDHSSSWSSVMHAPAMANDLSDEDIENVRRAH